MWLRKSLGDDPQAAVAIVDQPIARVTMQFRHAVRSAIERFLHLHCQDTVGQAHVTTDCPAAVGGGQLPRKLCLRDANVARRCRSEWRPGAHAQSPRCAHYAGILGESNVHFSFELSRLDVLWVGGNRVGESLLSAAAKQPALRIRGCTQLTSVLADFN